MLLKIKSVKLEIKINVKLMFKMVNHFTYITSTYIEVEYHDLTNCGILFQPNKHWNKDFNFFNELT